ncbi:hypothetical protein B0O80DRAFT_510822 [Mortierella sp. GBAus27b]|nr:hypothetical protein B0O80DRAFT_510822 [Mortierella sp. GBAus27b]
MSCFLEVNDGSSLKEIRSILSDGEGKGLELEGTLVKSLGKEQAFELQVSNMKVVGSCDAVGSDTRSANRNPSFESGRYTHSILTLGINTRLHLETRFPGRNTHKPLCYSEFWMLEVEMVFLNELDHHLDLQKDDSKRSHTTC